MFSNDIVGSDAFFDMPSTSQSLYFHLGMRCDDDGFVNPNVTMRMTGANKNDLDVLILKRFILPFKNGVMVLKHHRINNNWDARDCRRTLYTEELKLLFIKENRAYTFDEQQGESVLKTYPKISKLLLPDGNPTGTRRQNRIEENRRDTIAFSNEKDESSIKSNKKKTMKTFDIEKGEYIDEKPKAHKRQDVIELALLFDKLAKEYSGKPINTPGSYFIVLKAMNKPHKLTIEGIKKLYEDWFNNDKIKMEDKVNMTWCLGKVNINKFKVKN